MRNLELGKNYVIVERMGMLKKRKFYSPELAAEKLNVSMYHLQATMHEYLIHGSISINGVEFFSRQDLGILNRILFKGRLRFVFWGS